MYVVTASLYFLVFVALRQLQTAVKGTQVRVDGGGVMMSLHILLHTAYHQGV